MLLGVVGKGGSGKSLVAGTLARLLAQRNRRVVALDLDFMTGLATSLGVQAGDEPMFARVAVADVSSPWGWRSAAELDLSGIVLQYAATGPNGVRLLQIGKVRSLPAEQSLVASLGACYDVLRRLGESEPLVGWTVVGDHPAGMTQSRGGWVRYADTFLLVVEPTRQSVLSASRLLSLRENARVVLVANKVAGADDIGYIETHLDEPVWAALPSDPAILAADRAGHALVDHAPGSPVIGVMEQLADQLEDVTSDQVLRQGHAP